MKKISTLKKIFRGGIMMTVTAAVAGTAGAAEWFVAPWGDDAKDGKSWETAMKSPELVIDRWISEGGTISHTLTISNGTYKLTKPIRVSRNDGYSVDRVKIRSLTGNPEDVILDGQGACQGVYICRGSKNLISGLTVTNCAATDESGGGIYLWDDYNGRIENCIVGDCRLTMNEKSAHGAGIFAYCSVVSGCKVGNCSITNAPGWTPRTAYGAGIYCFRGMVTNCVVRNCGMNLTEGRDFYPVGGGVWLGTGGASNFNSLYPEEAVLDTVISGCAIYMPTYTSYGYGAGLAVNSQINDGADGTRYQARVEDVLVYDCTNHLGGVVYLQKQVNARNVTSSNNYDAAISGSSINATGLYLGQRCHAKGCLVTCNTGTTLATNGDEGGSPAVRMSGDSSLVDSVITSNSSPAWVALSMAASTAGAKILVSNCVFSANHMPDIGSTQRGGLIRVRNLAEGASALITDCRFVDNDVSNCDGGGWIRMENRVAEKEWEVRFRNCLCVGNRFGSTGATVYAQYDAQWNSNARLAFENCTVMDNTVGTWMINGYNEGSDWTYCAPSNVYVTACVVAGNVSERGYKGQIITLTGAYTTNVNYTVSTLSSGTWDPRQSGNKVYDPDSPLFADPTNGDYRPVSVSQARDMAPARAWMGTGSRRGPLDLGSGYTVAKSGKYGVAVLRENAVPRLSGTAADAGCCEFYSGRGMTLRVR